MENNCAPTAARGPVHWKGTFPSGGTNAAVARAQMKAKIFSLGFVKCSSGLGRLSEARLPFTPLQAFEAVARLGSYQAAATELCASNPGRHVAALEEHLGLKLVNSSPRGTLTTEGRILASALSKSFDQIAALISELHSANFLWSESWSSCSGKTLESNSGKKEE